MNQARVVRNIPLVTEDGKKQQLYLIGEIKKWQNHNPDKISFLDDVLRTLMPNNSHDEENEDHFKTIHLYNQLKLLR